MRIDVHQHIWTEPLLELLRERVEPPLLRRRGGLEILHFEGEQPCVIDHGARAGGERESQLRAQGIDLALIALSSPIGIEALPREAARELIDAHIRGVGALGSAFAAWGPVALEHCEAADADELLDRGCVGLSLPAGALADPARLDRVGSILERLAARGAPLFVHPGPAPGARTPVVALGEPLWWPALTGYVSQMQSAWLSFAARGRREHPRLRVVFAMLAGMAPLLAERLATRGGPPVELGEPLSFYETSSYGPEAIEAMARVVGERQLLYGSDAPVVRPIATERDPELQANAAELLLPARQRSAA